MSSIKLFEDINIRGKWNEDEDCWYLVVVDIIAFLTDSPDPTDYWYRLKKRAAENEGVELSTICRELKFKASNGKPYKYECANNEGIFRIIQSVPSAKAEPFKRWLAKLGKERIEEIEQPGKAIERGKLYYQYKGRTEDWVNDRSSGIQSRNELTDHWKSSHIKGKEYAILTNEIYVSTFGLTAVDYKSKKGLAKDDSLRDNMSNIELVVTRFAEVAAKEISVSTNAQGFWENKQAIKESGKIVGKAVKELENKTGKPVVSSDNFKHIDTDELTRRIVQSENTSITPISEFDKKLKGILNVPKPDKGKE